MTDLWTIPEDPEPPEIFSPIGYLGSTLPPQLEAGTILLDRFVINHLLGMGGSGMVYHASDQMQKRTIAIKILHPNLIETHPAIDSFLKEAHLSIALKHPHILRIYDAFDTNGLKALTMELLEGQTLRQELLSRPNFQAFLPDEAARYILPTAEALIYAHRSTIHCDIKPENIGISNSKEIKLMDFGIARFQWQHSRTTQRNTATHYQAGTPYYVSPEQIQDPSHIDHRADQFALGIVAYELLTGRPPIGFATPLQLRRRDLPVTLTNAIDRCLKTDPAERFPDMEAVAEELDRGFSQSRHPVIRHLTNSRTRSASRIAGLAIFLLIAFTLLIQSVVWHKSDQDDQADRIWNKLAIYEQQTADLANLSNQRKQQAWTAKIEFELALAKANNAAPSQWLTHSNAYHVAGLLAEPRGQLNPLGRNSVNQIDDLTTVRRLLIHGELSEAESMLRQIEHELEKDKSRSEHLEPLILNREETKALLQAARNLPEFALGNKPLLQTLQAETARAEEQLESELYADAVTAFASINVELRQTLQALYLKAEENLVQQKTRWQSLYPDLAPESLSFIANPTELRETGNSWIQLHRYDLAIESINQAASIFDDWSSDMERLLENSHATWIQSSNRIESSIGMRFVNVENIHISIWETRVVDFARFVADNPSAGYDAGNTWKAPGFPLSPTSPVVGVPRAVAIRFASWLPTTFPHYFMDPSLPNIGNERIRDLRPQLVSIYGPKKAVLVDPSDWNRGHFKENYESPDWTPGNFIQNVGAGKPNPNGIFDLQGNVWEWQMDDYTFQADAPSSHIRYPILRAGRAGTTTFHGNEPPEKDLEFVMRKEVIGFRVIVGATSHRDNL